MRVGVSERECVWESVWETEGVSSAPLCQHRATSPHTRQVSIPPGRLSESIKHGAAGVGRGEEGLFWVQGVGFRGVGV